MSRRTNNLFQSQHELMISSPLDIFLKQLTPTIVENVNIRKRDPAYIQKKGGMHVIEAYKETSKISEIIHDLVRDGNIDDSDTPIEHEITIPPLNTDIRMNNLLPEYANEEDISPLVFTALHPHDNHSELMALENFSWHTINESDNEDIKRKKSLIHPVQNQHMCGSCWAMALAACISDCFVVSGAVNWMPRIAPTFLMMSIPKYLGNSQCDGGNPASTAFALESMPIADTTCIDYSWCTNDKKVCTSAAAAHHFKSTLGSTLNANIPNPDSACYFEGDKYLYQIDSGTEALYITDKMQPTKFRDIIKRHIIEFGPPLAGYAVLNNFINGDFTNEDINQGIYFDRAKYSSITTNRPLIFNDSYASIYQLSGLHAVAVVGWGIGKNVQYDNDKYGDVPYWIARNSWGSSWGHMKGYFKIAMYPWNKFAQFGKQLYVHGAKIGGMIMVRCTKPPVIGKLKTINDKYLTNIVRSMDDEYYKSSPTEIMKSRKNQTTSRKSINWTNSFIIICIIIACGILIKILINNRRYKR